MLWEIIVLLTVQTALESNAYSWDESTPLDDYVNFDDGYFQWTTLTVYRFEKSNVSVYMVNMTSQKWMDDTLTDRPVWFHMMAVAIPDVIRRDIAWMWMDGGANTPDTQPAPPDDYLVEQIVNVAEQTGAVSAYIRNVPNEPIVFKNDPTRSSKTEDQIIAWTWHTFITTHQKQPQVILRMPMTKAAKRGFDTIHELIMKERGKFINKFVSSGASKRGWTAWSVAATDRRVIATVPVVMSLLNFNETLMSHYRCMGGGWTYKFAPYYNLNLTMKLWDEIFVKSPGGLWDYEDMFRYKERLGLIPKLMISAAGDEFFLLTDSHNWWDKMPGEKWISMIPNAEHSLLMHQNEAFEIIASFLYRIFNNLPIPQVSWKRLKTPSNEHLLFHTNVLPDKVAVWQATTLKNEKRKDFRLFVGPPPHFHSVLWHPMPFTDLGHGSYEVKLNSSGNVYTGYFFQATWIQKNGYHMSLTSEAQILPNTFPVPPCHGGGCYGHLV